MFGIFGLGFIGSRSYGFSADPELHSHQVSSVLASNDVVRFKLRSRASETLAAGTRGFKPIRCKLCSGRGCACALV